jgi:hypothetical protein
MLDAQPRSALLRPAPGILGVGPAGCSQVVRLMRAGAVAARQWGCGSFVAQHDPPHRTAGHTLDAGEQLSLGREPAAAVVAHPGQNVAEPPIPSGRDMALVDHAHLAAAVALDAQEPGRERGEWLGQRLGGRW